jgi:hypothetical protein
VGNPEHPDRKVHKIRRATPRAPAITEARRLSLPAGSH